MEYLRRKNHKKFKSAVRKYMKSNEGKRIFREHKPTVKVQRTKRSETSILVKIPPKMKKKIQQL